MKESNKHKEGHADQETFEAFQEGNWEALSKLYGKYRKEFLFWAFKWCDIEEEELKHIYQSALVIFYEKINTGSLKELRSSIKTYIFSICKILIKKHYSKTIRIQNYGNIDETLVRDWDLNIIDKMEEDYNKYIIQKALNKLDERVRQIFILFYYHNYSIEAIRIKLGYVSNGVVRTTKTRAIKKLEKIIQQLRKDH